MLSALPKTQKCIGTLYFSPCGKTPTVVMVMYRCYRKGEYGNKKELFGKYPELHNAHIHMQLFFKMLQSGVHCALHNVCWFENWECCQCYRVPFMYRRRPLLCTLYGAVDFLNVLKKGCWGAGGGVLLIHNEIHKKTTGTLIVITDVVHLKAPSLSHDRLPDPPSNSRTQRVMIRFAFYSWSRRFLVKRPPASEVSAASQRFSFTTDKRRSALAHWKKN